MWDHLSSKKELKRCQQASRAAFRATCKALRDIADDLNTQLQHLQLGWCLEDAKSDPSGLNPVWVRFTEDPDNWSVSQQTQQQRVRALLQRLPRLEAVVVTISQGGLSQLLQLLLDGCFRSAAQFKLVAEG